MAQKPLITLHPGQVQFAKADTQLATLLGSCVSVVLWHPHRQMGGMCHFMLPKRPANFPQRLPDGRYADEAMLILLQCILQQKTQPSEYRAWLVGGARILADQRSSIGDMNVLAGRALLTRYQISAAKEDVGGSGYRRVRFDPEQGTVHVQCQQPTTMVLAGSVKP